MWNAKNLLSELNLAKTKNMTALLVKIYGGLLHILVVATVVASMDWNEKLLRVSVERMYFVGPTAIYRSYDSYGK